MNFMNNERWNEALEWLRLLILLVLVLLIAFKLVKIINSVGFTKDIAMSI